MKVSMKARKEVIDAQKNKYTKATKKEKMQILTSLCEATGLCRDHVARLLQKKKTIFKKSKKDETRGRKIKYDKNLIKALEWIWALMDFACGKRLTVGIPIVLDALERNGELKFDSEVVLKLKEMSASTIDRLLKSTKKTMSFKGISTTKPGTLLKKDIPLRLGTEWNDAVPGYVEIDLVAHCGETAAGEFIYTLDVTDICTGWTETQAVLNKAQKRVFEGLLKIEERLPFKYLGIDSDNGSEFINKHLYKYCKKEEICFTRSRPSKKNDGCHVEQKNWAVVRKNIGYDRYEGEDACRLLNSYYELLGLYSNFFLPQTKLLEKYREGAKMRKKYDAPKTPHQRVKESVHISDSKKKKLDKIFLKLNPLEIKKEMVEILESLMELRVSFDSNRNRYHKNKPIENKKI